MEFLKEKKKPIFGKQKEKEKYEWLKLLFETPRLGIEKEPGLIVDIEEEYRVLQRRYEFKRG